MLVIGSIVAIAAALWFLIAVRRCGLMGGCLLVIFTGSVFGHAFFHLSIVTLDRLLWGLLIGLFLFQRMRGDLARRPVAIMDWLLLMVLGILTVNTMAHDWKYDGAQPASRLLFLYLLPAGVYWVVSQLTLRDSTLRVIWISAAVFGGYLSLTAIAEAIGIRAIVFPRYILSEQHAEFLGRGRGPFLNPVANGIYIVTCLGGLWMLWPNAKGVLRSLIPAGTLVMLAGALATLTRCVWVGAAASSMLVMWWTFPKGKRLGIAMLGICAVALTLGSQWDKVVAFKRDKNVSVSDMAKSASLRPMLAAVAWQIFTEHPLNGVGLGQYRRQSGVYIARRAVDLPLEQVRGYSQHNVILSWLTELGILGTGPLLVMFALWTRRAWQIWLNKRASLCQRQAGLLALVCLVNYFANGMFHDVALIPMVNLILFFCAGLVSSIAKSIDLATIPELIQARSVASRAYSPGA